MENENLIESIIHRGWYTCPNFIDDEVCQKLIAQLKQSELTAAHIGQGSKRALNQELRNDTICWFNDENLSEFQQLYLSKIHRLMDVINRELFLGLKQFEGHFAHYRPSGFYKKHLDQFKSNQERLVSVITYLNSPLVGGELRLYKKENPDEKEIDISPCAGTLVCFLSNQIYHEVLPTENERYSITGWLRTTIR